MSSHWPHSLTTLILMKEMAATIGMVSSSNSSSRSPLSMSIGCQFGVLLSFQSYGYRSSSSSSSNSDYGTPAVRSEWPLLKRSRTVTPLMHQPASAYGSLFGHSCSIPAARAGAATAATCGAGTECARRIRAGSTMVRDEHSTCNTISGSCSRRGQADTVLAITHGDASRGVNGFWLPWGVWSDILE